MVVLPFDNMGDDPEQQYFADGITEDLTTDLSRIADMFVISRNTAFTYRNKPVETRQIGRELNVRYVLEKVAPAHDRPLPASAARPRLRDEEGQILGPVLGGHPAGVDHVSQIIFCIGQHKSRVVHSIILAGTRRFAGWSEVCGALGCGGGGLTTGQTDKARVEISSQARSTGALSLAGSVVTNTTLTRSPISVGSCCRLLAILAMWSGHSSGHRV
jgi:hypothetical protein